MPESLTPFSQARWVLQELFGKGLLDVDAASNGKVRVASLCAGLGTDLIACHALSETW
jgi:hypothetical protein